MPLNLQDEGTGDSSRGALSFLSRKQLQELTGVEITAKTAFVMQGERLWRYVGGSVADAWLEYEPVAGP